MEKVTEKYARFELRLSPGEAFQLERISNKLNITRSQVLRLSLSPQKGQTPQETEARSAVSAETMDRVFSRMSAQDDRMNRVESTLETVVEMMQNSIALLLSISQNVQPAPASVVEEKPAAKVGKVPPAWSAYLVKYIRPNNFRTEEEWVEYLRNHYIKNIGFPPDMTT